MSMVRNPGKSPNGNPTYYDSVARITYELMPDGTMNPISSAGAAHVETEAGSVWSYGNWPEYNLLSLSYSGAMANQVIANLSPYNSAELVIEGLTTDTIAISNFKQDGVTVANPVLLRKTDGTFAAATGLSNGTFLVPVASIAWNLNKTGAVDNATAKVTINLKSVRSI